jgi:antitoxin (DNA-binding transcriptional repressor) of toxin-antitoxin stability system
MQTGIRELKDNLSHYIRRLRSGERIAVTAHGRVVAELVAPSAESRTGHPGQYLALVAQGLIRPALEPGNLPNRWPEISLPAGTAARLIDEDRGEA